MTIALGRAILLCFAFGVDASAVQKVLQMLGDMKAKAIDEKNSELVTFTTFFQFCKDTTASRQQAIDESSAVIAKLSADVLKYGADVEALSTEVEDLDALVDKAQADVAAAVAVRKKEQEDYEARHSELVESIEELKVGISQLQNMMRTTDAASLIQTAVRIAARSRTAQLASMLAARAQLVNGLAAPEAAAYESKSGGIVDLMDELLEKMKEEMDTLEKEEMQAKGSFDMMAQTLNDQIEQHSSAREFKSKTIKEKQAAALQAKGEQADAASSKAEDETYLGEVHMECATKSSDFEQEQKLRAGEITALSKAIEIISGSAVSGNAEGKSVSGLAQTDVVASLAQLRVNAVRSSQTAVAAFLQAQGHQTGSKILSLLALRASSDPFAKVKKMIQDMVYKLMEEANEEAEHKGFCDKEMGTNKMTRDQKGTEVEELSASIDEAGAQVAALAQRIAALSDEVAALDASLREATAVRREEREKNEATVTEAKRGSAAVAQALGVLQEFYSGAASGAALLQARGTTVAGAAKTQSDASAGVIGMLEVILSDFERLEATTKEAEDMSQSDFEQFTADSSKTKAVKSTNLKNLADSRAQLEVETSQLQKDLESAQAELSAAHDYFEKLKPSCVEAGVSYEDRVARRKEEIESLQDALKML